MKRASPLAELGLHAAPAAVRRAAERARRTAAQAGTPLAVWRDGAIATIDPARPEPVRSGT